ncbi:TlpA family protein disulfide reductase [Snuella sedimenti]|uniref:TlpA family protein disulfide reductase n=1 Tax=Snuella sedimenti TaxID=2798802 RepID=A0A8J7IG97_9FLAO|nr:TlpA disulfide reductase family protein [Snuella sedimenti]MBJ6368897.1 TlpA family protein disulfide reductase [Snuella sedimenti]
MFKRIKGQLKVSNVIFFIVIALLVIPVTRQPIQVFINKGLALFSPSTIKKEKRRQLKNYDWQLRDTNGRMYDFESAKGRVVFVNFWATWCPPCIAEMPSVQALYKDYKDRVSFVLVSNEAVGDIVPFLDKYNYDFIVYNPITDFPELFDVTSIPRTFLIDKGGNVVMDKAGAANWNSDNVREVIEKLLLE